MVATGVGKAAEHELEDAAVVGLDFIQRLDELGQLPTLDEVAHLLEGQSEVALENNRFVGLVHHLSVGLKISGAP